MLMIHLGSRVRPQKGMFKKQQLSSPSITSWGGCPITAGLWLGYVGWKFIVGARINCLGPRGEASHAIQNPFLALPCATLAFKCMWNAHQFDSVWGTIYLCKPLRSPVRFLLCNLRCLSFSSILSAQARSQSLRENSPLSGYPHPPIPARYAPPTPPFQPMTPAPGSHLPALHCSPGS